MKRTRSNDSAAFKAKGALAALVGKKIVAGRAQHYQVHPNQVLAWKVRLVERAAQVLGGEAVEPELLPIIKEGARQDRAATDGERFLIGGARRGAHAERKERIDKTNALPMADQCRPVARPNQVWAVDITYISMFNRVGFLGAIIDVFSSKERAHRLFNMSGML